MRKIEEKTIEHFLKLKKDELIKVENYLRVKGFKILFSNLLKHIVKELVSNLIENIQVNFQKKKKKRFGGHKKEEEYKFSVEE